MECSEKRILLALNSFKGSLSSKEANACVYKAIQSFYPKIGIEQITLADGGEGSLDAVAAALVCETIHCHTYDAAMNPIDAKYLFHPPSKTAYIESAASIGITLLQKQQLSAFKLQSYGLGVLMLHAKNIGAECIVVFLGGTATTDGGIGMLQALGFKRIDSNGHEITNLDLHSFMQTHEIQVPPNFTFPEVIIATDVDNPLVGPTGAAYVFAPQKGALPDELPRLDAYLKKMAEIATIAGKRNCTNMPGAGAAGGIGGALMAWFKASCRSGARYIGELHQLETKLAVCDVVISGEGKLDTQSLYGKLPGMLAEMSLKHRKTLVIICGKNELPDEKLKEAGISHIAELASSEEDIPYAITHAYSRLFAKSQLMAHTLFAPEKEEINKEL